MDKKSEYWKGRKGLDSYFLWIYLLIAYFWAQTAIAVARNNLDYWKNERKFLQNVIIGWTVG